MVGIIYEERVHEVLFPSEKLIIIDGLPYDLPPEIASVREAMKFALFEIQYNPKHGLGAK